MVILYDIATVILGILLHSGQFVGLGEACLWAARLEATNSSCPLPTDLLER